MDPQCPSPQMREAFQRWLAEEWPGLAEGEQDFEDRRQIENLREAFWHGMEAAVQILAGEGSLQ